MPVLAPLVNPSWVRFTGLLDLELAGVGVNHDARVLQIDEILLLEAAQPGQHLIGRPNAVEIENHQVAHDASPLLLGGRIQASAGTRAAAIQGQKLRGAREIPERWGTVKGK